jgi:hypothetical protein
MTEEAQRAALAALVHAISRLDTTLRWGEGRTSASDGQRFAMPRKVLQQTSSTRFSDFALEFSSFVADNYAPFYSTPIECTDRDAAFVLDGLLYNESDLELEEPYTDTHGYTVINFAAFAMRGRRFCPRIRGLPKQRLYRLDVGRDYGPLAGLVGRADPRSTPRSSPSSGTEWDSSMRRWRAVTRPPRSRSNASPHAPPRAASTGSGNERVKGRLLADLHQFFTPLHPIFVRLEVVSRDG